MTATVPENPITAHYRRFHTLCTSEAFQLLRECDEQTVVEAGQDREVAERLYRITLTHPDGELNVKILSAFG